MADIREDGSEIFHYDISDYAISIKKNYIPDWYRFNDLSIHWHEEIEITYVVSGSINHQLNGRRMKLNAGEAIFINSKQLHLIETDNVDCTLYCLIFHPTILCPSNHIARKYVSPITDNEGLDYFLLKETDESHKPILDAIVRIEELQHTSDSELKTMSVLNELWLDLYGVLPHLNMEEVVVNENLHKVQKMLSLIHKSYASDINLDDICNAGGVGKTKGTHIFKEYLNMTPIEYLINYRLEVAAHMIHDTRDSVIDIAFMVGFSDSSYFARAFRKRTGMSPLEYRQKCEEEE